MGKIVKYCAACDENFAEKFGFCPNCGQEMTAFEMNPVSGGIIAAQQANGAASEAVEDENILEIPATESLPAVGKGQTVLTGKATDTQSFNISETQIPAAYKKSEAASNGDAISAVATSEEVKAEAVEVEETLAEMPAPETKTFAAAAGANGNGFGNSYQTQSGNYQSNGAASDKGFNVTVIEDTNVKQRNLLLLGSLIFMTSLAFGGLIYNLFTHSIYVGSIDEDNPLYVAVIEDAPMEVEQQEKKIDKEKGGGGGGGGRDEKTPTSQGRLATQTEKPLISPTKTIPQKDFDLQYQASTQGKNKIKPTDEAYGDPNSKSRFPSDGSGSGGGQGSGFGTGQGSGRGTGQGSGIGSGSGSGIGDGTGDGTGRGGNVPPKAPAPPEPKPVGPSEAIKILSKPQPRYTDAARTNNVQGTVTLKITFLANGQIGSISPVSGLPYGLTEQAIAAARQIRFDPPKKNGAAYSVSKTLAYTFTIY